MILLRQLEPLRKPGCFWQGDDRPLLIADVCDRLADFDEKLSQSYISFKTRPWRANGQTTFSLELEVVGASASRAQRLLESTRLFEPMYDSEEGRARRASFPTSIWSTWRVRFDLLAYEQPGIVRRVAALVGEEPCSFREAEGRIEVMGEFGRQIPMFSFTGQIWCPSRTAADMLNKQMKALPYPLDSELIPPMMERARRSA